MAASSQTVPGMPLDIDLHLIENGVPLETMTRFMESSGLELKDIYNVVIPARTLKHRRALQQTLSVDESDKLARLIRTFNHAVRVFGQQEKVTRWMRKPKRRFSDRTPLQMLQTETGGRMVEEMIWQIAEGMFV